MRIALIDPSLFTPDYDFMFASALQNVGATVDLYGPTGKEFNSSFKYIPFFYGFVNTSKIPKVLKLLFKGAEHIKNMYQLVATLRAAKYDAIHFQWTPLPIVDIYFLKKIHKFCKIILTVHDPIPFNGNPSSKLQLIGWRSLLKTFDQLIVHTEVGKGILLEYGIKSKNISVIPHGIAKFPNTGVKYHVYESSWRHSLTTILFFGQIKPYKGIDILIDSLGLLDTDVLSKLRVIIAGNVKCNIDKLENLAKEKKVDSAIYWDLRFISEQELDDMLTRADILVFPYRAIDASGAFMAAVAYGKAVIASNLGVFKEIIVDGENGYLVDVESVEKMASYLSLLVNDKNKLEKIGLELGKIAVGKYSWKNIAKATICLYQAIV